MTQYAFGAGNIIVTQLEDASGNAISNPTPYPLATLQEGSIDFSSDLKELYGQNQFPEAVGRGKGKVSIKVKSARIVSAVWNALYFGQTLNTGLLGSYIDITGSVIPSTPYQITVTPPNSGTYSMDLGVKNSTGTPLKRVASSPATGQYSVNVSTGVYTFASADAASTAYISYMYTTSSGGYNMDVMNVPMGYAPTFQANLVVVYRGKMVNIAAWKATSSKFNLGFKSEDFLIPEFDMMCMDNGSGKVVSISTSE